MEEAYHIHNKEILPMDEVYNKIVGTLVNYMNNNTLLKNIVIGISGGIDSTVCAAIAHEAARRLNLDKFRDSNPVGVVGLSLPSTTNADNEVTSADKVMAAFCTQYDTLHIDNFFNLVHEAFVTYDGPLDKLKNVSNIGDGNFKARIRMMLLYQTAAAYSGFVIDTDNLSEYYLGFYTRSGDQFDYSPLSGLWKDEVYALADYIKDHTGLNELQKEAISASMGIAPTDGNNTSLYGHSDTDQIAFGHTYTEIDEVLGELLETTPEAVGLECSPLSRIEMVYERLNDGEDTPFYPDDESDDIDYPYDMVEAVCKRHFSTEFKRAGHPIRVPRELYLVDKDSMDPRDIYEYH